MENNNDKFISMIGFAKRSGKIVYGLDNLKNSRAVKLLAVSSTASDNLKRNMALLADKKQIPIVTAEQLELIVGNNVKALGFTDGNMASAVTDYVGPQTPNYTIKYGKGR